MPYVGIMGGTFDPIHFGHLAAAEGVKHLLGLDRVLFMPNRQPPHKVGRRVSALEHRVAMVKLAIADNPAFEFSDMELRREGPSYTIDTIRAFQVLHPDWRTAFIVGMDSLVEIQTWKEYRTLLTLTDLAVVGRPGSYSDRQRDEALGALGPELTARVRLLETLGVVVSGTALRSLAAKGYPLRYLVPDAVAGYIRKHWLYAAT
jgi:nicotinate-nucleotide adenylyltransferase